MVVGKGVLYFDGLLRYSIILCVSGRRLTEGSTENVPFRICVAAGFSILKPMVSARYPDPKGVF